MTRVVVDAVVEDYDIILRSFPDSSVYP